MAPILSLPRESLDRIREAIAPSLVSIWQVDSSSGSKVAFRSGFVYDSEIGKCTILTLKKGLDIRRKVFVQFENGERFEGSGTLINKESNLFAILVSGLRFEPRKVSNSEHEAHQCEEVVHMGMFDEEKAKFNFSSGSVGSVGHTVIIRKKKFTRFSHCCSQNLHLIGGPVFNLQSKLVGVNYSQREGKNLFFALNLAQLDNEVEMLFGKNMEHAADFMKGIEIHKAKRRKKK